MPRSPEHVRIQYTCVVDPTAETHPMRILGKYIIFYILNNPKHYQKRLSYYLYNFSFYL